MTMRMEKGESWKGLKVVVVGGGGGFFTTIPCTYSSLPIDGMARN